MENEIKKLLDENETLLWFGKPEKFELLDAEYKKKLKTSCIFWAIVLLIIEACVAGLQSGLGTGINIISVIIPVLLCGLFVFIEFSEGNRIKKLTYALTDKNIIIKGACVKKCPYELIKYCDIETDAAGIKSLICGAQTDHVGREINPRMLTMLCMERGLKGRYLADALALYAIPDEAIEILKKSLPIGERF